MGIGTPRSQSSMERPMASPFQFECLPEKRADRDKVPAEGASRPRARSEGVNAKNFAICLLTQTG